MNADEIKFYFEELNAEMKAMDMKGEVCLYGGAVMCLVYNARPSTKDVDAVFAPAAEMRIAIERVAQAHNLTSNWLNDAVKGFLVPHEQKIWFDLSNLKVFVPAPDYLLAMKAMAARVDATDKQDLRLLIKKLGLKTADDVFTILEKYYPRGQIKPATQFFVEELFEQ